ncbi:hypothetical protein [Streptomyces sp. NPDC054784]
MATAVFSFPDAGSGAGSSEAGTDTDRRYEQRFLLWLWQQTDGVPGVPVSTAGFGARQSIPEAVVRAVADRLRGRGLIRVHAEPVDARRDGPAHADGTGGIGAGSTGTAPSVSFEPAGADQARSLRERRDDRAARGHHAREAVLRWIFAQVDRRPLRIEEFFDSREIFFLGEALSRGEVARSVAYLSEAGLITCAGPDFHDGVGSHMALTPLGVDAVLGGTDIGRYVDQQRERTRPFGGTQINGTVHNFVNRDLTVHGGVQVQLTLTPSQLADLARQLSGTLALDDEARARLLESADALRQQDDDGDGDTDADGSPERGGLLARMRRSVECAPDSIGRQLLLDAISQVMGRVLG